MTVMLNDFNLGYSYVFLDQFGEAGDSNQYFTRLFIDLVRLVLNPIYHNRLLHYSAYAIEYNHEKVKYVIVDDDSYSGYQMRNCILDVPEGDLYIILVAASCNALKFLREGKSLDLEPRVPRCNITNAKIFVGKVFENLNLDPETLFLEWDVVYESEGKLHCLLFGLTGADQDDKFDNTFYFQHKLADDLSLPSLLRYLPNPEKVTRVLSQEEKLLLLPIDSNYWKQQMTSLYQLVPDVEPFYREILN